MSIQARLRRGVAFVAGEGFYASNVNPRTLRLSFGYLRGDMLAAD